MSDIVEAFERGHVDEAFALQELGKTEGCYTAKKLIKEAKIRRHLKALKMDYSVNSNLIAILELMLDEA
jgi:hypothetical protein